MNLLCCFRRVSTRKPRHAYTDSTREWSSDNPLWRLYLNLMRVPFSRRLDEIYVQPVILLCPENYRTWPTQQNYNGHRIQGSTTPTPQYSRMSNRGKQPILWGNRMDRNEQSLFLQSGRREIWQKKCIDSAWVSTPSCLPIWPTRKAEHYTLCGPWIFHKLLHDFTCFINTAKVISSKMYKDRPASSMYIHLGTKNRKIKNPGKSPCVKILRRPQGQQEEVNRVSYLEILHLH